MRDNPYYLPTSSNADSQNLHDLVLIWVRCPKQFSSAILTYQEEVVEMADINPIHLVVDKVVPHGNPGGGNAVPLIILMGGGSDISSSSEFGR